MTTPMTLVTPFTNRSMRSGRYGPGSTAGPSASRTMTKLDRTKTPNAVVDGFFTPERDALTDFLRFPSHPNGWRSWANCRFTSRARQWPKVTCEVGARRGSAAYGLCNRQPASGDRLRTLGSFSTPMKGAAVIDGPSLWEIAALLQVIMMVLLVSFCISLLAITWLGGIRTPDTGESSG